ncbi:MAG: hypothetical protein JNK67_26240 [Alphaproteobacteria bacterium]|nr:hypothetical protein [Alphaproteobacteria bacterium]
MHFDKALSITRSWIERGAAAPAAFDSALMIAATCDASGAGDPAADAAAQAEALRRLAQAARRAIPSIDVIATRDEAKLGLRAVAELERRAVALESRETGAGFRAA